MKSQSRRLVVIGLLVTACGGGGGAGNEGGDTTAPGLATTTSTTTNASATTSAGGVASGDGSISYTITGGVEASGEAGLFPGMSFVDGGIWTLAFGSGSTLIIIGLDPSTPSINWTNGAEAVGGTSSECTFQIDRQDENGAAGSVECSGAATTGAGGLLDGSDISATFDANP